MRADRVHILKPGFRVIDIDHGHARELKVDTLWDLEHADGQGHLAYYVLKGTRDGAITRYWEDQQRAGVIRLTVIAEDGDPTLDGITLPIRNSSQLTEWQREHTVCGHLVKGHFLCERCTLKHPLTYPDAIAVYPINILPYSQRCSECGLLIFDIWQSRKGGPLILFD